MRYLPQLLSLAGAAMATSLASVCTTTYIQAALPSDDFYTGFSVNVDSVVAHAVYNYSVADNTMFPGGAFDYCNITFTYTHVGRNDTVELAYWLPTPANFQNRFLTTGGGGEAINSVSSLPGGVLYGAVSGMTDGGFGSWSNEFDDVFIIANGTINYDALYMFGYLGIHEMTVLGQEFTKLFYNLTTSGEKLYSYYQACSEGGREGWSQIQRYGSQFDGSIVGAPAFRYGFQQTNHLVGAVIEKTMGYYPPQCELDQILNETIAACDALDGRSDGVVSRSDLCKLKFNLNSTVGTPYYCAASSGAGGFGKRQMGGSTTPAQNGTITAEAVSVVEAIWNGLKDSNGRQVYLSYQRGAALDDAGTTYDSSTGTWDTSAYSGIGGTWVGQALEFLDTSTISNWDNVTYDTLKDWMILGWQRYDSIFQTTWPDLTPYYENGGKILHYHGESDYSIPTASSVRYFESVRSIMYPGLPFNESTAELDSWYRLFLVPGAGHCSTNDLQPNGPFPQTNLAVMIDWVENGVEPKTLNATVLQGENEGEQQQICSWPLRPYWNDNGTSMVCEYDQASIDTWLWDFDGVKMPVY